MSEGTLEQYWNDRGFGFILPDDVETGPLFVHHSAFFGGLPRAKYDRPGVLNLDRVTFDVGEHDGKSVAVNVKILRPPTADAIKYGGSHG
jgi:cold shock CspA family protein